MNPLECLMSKRDEITKEYLRVLTVNFPHRTSKNGICRFTKQKEFELLKIRDIIEQYEVTINTLKALNSYEYLAENS